MENKRGSGIFLGVVGVATLVVAIIGATFAYFTATVSGTAPVTAQAYEFAMTLSVNKIAPSTAANAKDLIPLTTADIGTALTGAANKSACVDKDDFAACLIYELEFSNTGSSAVTLDGKLTPTVNEFDSLYYRVATTQAGLSSATSHALSGTTAVTDDLTSIAVGTGQTNLYLMLYIQNDTGNDQPNDKGAAFSGTLDFQDANGGSNAHLQATFS